MDESRETELIQNCLDSKNGGGKLSNVAARASARRGLKHVDKN
jgi:hypothetical protein